MTLLRVEIVKYPDVITVMKGFRFFIKSSISERHSSEEIFVFELIRETDQLSL